MPTLVYLAREKRPQNFHNFKAGALNTLVNNTLNLQTFQTLLSTIIDELIDNNTFLLQLSCLQIRVSSEISNGQIIMNVDCDMYSSNPETVRDALCFFLDEEKGQEIAYVQLPQRFSNITKNDLYDSAITTISEVSSNRIHSFHFIVTEKKLP